MDQLQRSGGWPGNQEGPLTVKGPHSGTENGIKVIVNAAVNIQMNQKIRPLLRQAPVSFREIDVASRAQADFAERVGMGWSSVPGR